MASGAAHVLGILARIVLGAVFLAAGTYKLRDGPAWPRQAADMGVGRRVATVVPWVELAVGAALVAQLAVPWPTVLALVLLISFTLVIANRLLDGTRPPCGCFGSRSGRPLGRRHIVRNLALLALGALALL